MHVFKTLLSASLLLVCAATVGATAEAGKRRPSRVRQSKATVDGHMDKDIIRRIVRAHINEIRWCYNEGLKQDPKLAGRTVIRFTILDGGSVRESDVYESDLPDEDVAECMADAVLRWKFPAEEERGAIVVTYPFVLTPE